MGTMLWNGNELEILEEADVIVCGGGPAGIGAALASKETDSATDVLLVEQVGCLGGMGTAGLVPAFIHMTDGENLVASGIAKRVVDELAKRMGREPNYNWMNIQPEILKHMYDEWITGAGIKLFLGMSIVDVVCEKGRLKGIVVSTKAGLKCIAGKVFVDGTGDGNVCAWAGADFEVGDERGKTMAPSLCVMYSGIDWEKYHRSFRETGKGFRELWFEYVESGKAPLIEWHLPGIFPTGENIGTGNIGHIYGINCLDERDITKGYVEGRRIAQIYFDFAKKNVPGFEKAELVCTASLLSVRETRRIKGEYVLNYEDYINRAHFDDEIGCFAYPIDIHASDADAQDQKRVEKELAETHLGKGENYGIPYRSLIPKGLNNVLVAGRCISTDRRMQSSIRVMPGCFITGQGAGVAAALANKHNVDDVRNIDIAALRSILREQGAYLPDS